MRWTYSLYSTPSLSMLIVAGGEANMDPGPVCQNDHDNAPDI